VRLHGSVHGGIVPPTSLKADTGNWKYVLRLLAAATDVRVVGYSLPESDTHVQYLFKAAGVKPTTHLHRFDVIDADPTNVVFHRYEDFVAEGLLREARADARAYLTACRHKAARVTQRGSSELVEFVDLERMHEEFMQTHLRQSV